MKIEHVKLQFISLYTFLCEGRKENGLRTEGHLTFSRRWILQIAFWYVTPCSLVVTYWRFGETRDLYPTLKTEAAYSSETSVYLYQTARFHVSEDTNLSDAKKSLVSSLFQKI
jgi:hypothetical protein